MNIAARLKCLEKSLSPTKSRWIFWLLTDEGNTEDPPEADPGQIQFLVDLRSDSVKAQSKKNRKVL